MHETPTDRLRRFADDLLNGGTFIWKTADGQECECSPRAIAKDLTLVLNERTLLQGMTDRREGLE